MTNRVRVLFIAPQAEQPRRLPVLTPIGLLSIAGYLRKYGFEVKVYNANFIPKGSTDNIISNTERILKNYALDILGLGFTEDCFNPAVNTARLAKEINSEIKVMVGGVYPTAMPEQTLEVPQFDYLVHGEGEITTLELVQALSEKTNLTSVQGISYKKDGKIITTQERPEIVNLDMIPYDYRDLLIDYQKYPKESLGQIHTSRGCVYSCAYCSAQIIWGKKARFRSVENVLAELEYLYNKYKVRDFNFADDNFTLEPERMRAICDGIIQKGLKMRWRCCARADIHKQFNMKLLKLMKQSGCQNICIGFESGSQQVLDRADRGVKINTIETLLQMIKQAGIKVHADFIVGLPGENEMTLNQTLGLMKKIWQSARPTMSVAIFKAYPGTLAYQRNEFPDLKGLSNKIKEIFSYAETCNIKNLSGNTKYIRNRIAETITNPKQLASLFSKVIRTWANKND